LTFKTASGILSAMNSLLHFGFNGCVRVLPEKRFLISLLNELQKRGYLWEYEALSTNNSCAPVDEIVAGASCSGDVLMRDGGMPELEALATLGRKR
jgi:hypothetical protein